MIGTIIKELRATVLSVFLRFIQWFAELWRRIKRDNTAAADVQSAKNHDTLDEQVWVEMITCKTFSLAIERYADRCRSRNRWWTVATTSVAALGGASFFVKVSHEYGPFLSTVVLVALQVVKSFFPIFNHTPAELDQLDRICVFFLTKLHDLESLWNKINIRAVNTQEIEAALSAITRDIPQQRVLMNKLVRNIHKYEHRAISKEADEYLQSKFNSNEQ